MTIFEVTPTRADLAGDVYTSGPIKYVSADTLQEVEAKFPEGIFNGYRIRAINVEPIKSIK